MRLIKFRAWERQSKKMLIQDDLGLVKFVVTFSGDFGYFDFDNQMWSGVVPSAHYELMQFTGLRDKNGTDIYEGDVVKQDYHAETGSYEEWISFDGHHIGEVIITASKGACIRHPFHYSMDTDETEKINQYKRVAGYRCEVIGNIYEHPNLLKED